MRQGGVAPLAPRGCLAPGRWATLWGLRARAGLNGADVRLTRYDAERGRWEAVVLGSGERVRARPPCLTPAGGPGPPLRAHHKGGALKEMRAKGVGAEREGGHEADGRRRPAAGWLSRADWMAVLPLLAAETRRRLTAGYRRAVRGPPGAPEARRRGAPWTRGLGVLMLAIPVMLFTLATCGLLGVRVGEAKKPGPHRGWGRAKGARGT